MLSISSFIFSSQLTVDKDGDELQLITLFELILLEIWICFLSLKKSGIIISSIWVCLTIIFLLNSSTWNLIFVKFSSFSLNCNSLLILIYKFLKFEFCF